MEGEGLGPTAVARGDRHLRPQLPAILEARNKEEEAQLGPRFRGGGGRRPSSKEAATGEDETRKRRRGTKRMQETKGQRRKSEETMNHDRRRWSGANAATAETGRGALDGCVLNPSGNDKFARTATTRTEQTEQDATAAVRAATTTIPTGSHRRQQLRKEVATGCGPRVHTKVRSTEQRCPLCWRLT